MKKQTDRAKLTKWQERLATNEAAYAAELSKMDEREALYIGTRRLRDIVDGETKTEAVHVRNLCAEIIEAQTDSNIPQPKVTARREKDEGKAKLIEDMIRGELDRMPFEMLNDMMERTVPIQGGAAFLVEWDNTRRTHYTVGELAVSVLHPKQIIPQNGVYTGIEDMDYIILKVPQTKEYIGRRYGVSVQDESEAEPDIKGSTGEAAAADLVTQYIAYYRNDKGGIGLYSWVGDTQLEDLEDYQARRLRRCKKCGATEPADLTPIETPPELLRAAYGENFAGALPALDRGADPFTGMPDGTGGGMQPPTVRRSRGKCCPYCGCDSFEESEEEYEELYVPVRRSDGSEIGGTTESIGVFGTTESIGVFGTELDEAGLPLPQSTAQPMRIPFYKPDIFPVLLQRNVSVYGKFLGDSDMDKIADQQNTTNRIEAKIIDKLLKSGSYLTLPNDASIRVDAEDCKVIRIENPADKTLIGVYDLQGNISQDIAYLAQVYEEARQLIGITDSFQGRTDATATSGKAKEFAAAQSAGRLESKRVMKNAAYAALFEAMFKFKLAYTDEPRPVLCRDLHGNAEYREFNRFDFLEQDAAGEWCWNDQFLFSCDTSAPLASNREAMWQETRMNLQTGAFGDPAQLETLILFWSKMELLHYPGAGETRTYLEEALKKREEEKQQQMQLQQQQIQLRQMQQEQQAQRQQQMQAATQAQNEQAAQRYAQSEIIRRAREDAARDAAPGGMPQGQAPAMPGAADTAGTIAF